MDSLLIHGPARLSGTVRVSGSKNTALPLLFSSLLFDQETHFTNVPRLWDVETTLQLLGSMGTESQWDKESGNVVVYPKVHRAEAPYDFVKKMRAGILALGPLVARCGYARVSLPGGCAIGARPVNYHIQALERMGVSIEVDEGYIIAKVNDRLRGAEIDFPEITVTGTENILIAASVADGMTVIKNAAMEPEVTALGELLIRCGAKIEGLGTSSLRITGTTLQAPRDPIQIPPDRIEAGTWVAASAITRSPLVIEGVDASAMGSVLDAFRQTGVGIEVLDQGTRLAVSPQRDLQPLNLATAPYPGFATDMQAQLMAVLCTATGESFLRETIFENRFMHVAELRRMGALIETDGNHARIHGPTILRAAPVMATDLRASASLVLAALAAEGATRISRIYHLDRGYQRLDLKLSAAGARVERVKE